MRETRIALAAALVIAGCATTPVGEGERQPPPRLVVVVVVDQLRPDLLARYDSLFTGGLRRLSDRARWYVNATHDHAYTKTAPGHATLSTGVHPSRNGIVANSWWTRVNGTWTEMENVGDSASTIVGAPALPGVSPRNLLRDGFADWLTRANPRSQVATVSAKDRGAVLLAARTRGHVYWFAPEVGRFVTSTYYRTADPGWVDGFHSTVMAGHQADTVWSSIVPASERWRSRPDTQPHENDATNTYFPHRYSVERESDGTSGFWDWFENTPRIDAATLRFATAMLRSLSLGRDDATDLLGVSLSATDRVGHAFGPLSREQLDNLLRLDRELGDFLTTLDREVGANRYVVALSADHGVATSPEDAIASGETRAHRMTDADRAALAGAVEQAGARLESAPDSAASERLATEVRKLSFVANAYTHRQLESAQHPDSFAVLFARSYYPNRYVEDVSRYGLEVLYTDGFVERATGTDHGSPYWYDRLVPFVLMGPGIPAGRDSTRASTADMAPTLARIVGVPVPDDLDGKPVRWPTR